MVEKGHHYGVIWINSFTNMKISNPFVSKALTDENVCDSQKTWWKKEQMVVTSICSFSQNIFENHWPQILELYSRQLMDSSCRINKSLFVIQLWQWVTRMGACTLHEKQIWHGKFTIIVLKLAQNIFLSFKIRLIFFVFVSGMFI